MRRFSRGCPYRATDARQVAGDACRDPVGSRAAIAPLVLLTVVFGYVGGAGLPADLRKVDRAILIVAESGDFYV
jgi:hypothetical protein